MAEALGAIASIVGIVAAGAKLSIALFDLAGSLKSAGSEVRAIGTEITLFCSVLQQLERTLAKAKDRRCSISAIETTQKILEQCRFIFDEINGIVGRLQKQKSSLGDISVDFKARMKWLFKRSKVQQYRAMLESCKITLHLMLTTLEFAERVSARRQVSDHTVRESGDANYRGRLSTAETELEDEQEELMTQSLAIAQRCAVDRLEKLEEKELEVEEADKPGAIAIEMQERTRLIGITPPSDRHRSDFPTARPKRTSVWLNELLSLNDGPADSRRAPTGNDARRFSQLPHLLWKWTDQGEHWTKLREEAHSSDEIHEERQIGPHSESQPEHQHSCSAIAQSHSLDEDAHQKIVQSMPRLPRKDHINATLVFPLSPASPKTDRDWRLHDGSTATRNG